LRAVEVVGNLDQISEEITTEGYVFLVDQKPVLSVSGAVGQHFGAGVFEALAKPVRPADCGSVDVTNVGGRLDWPDV
jgi:hypothetical protein